MQSTLKSASSERTRSVRRLLGGQIAIPVMAVALSAFGVLMVYSASFYTAETVYGDKFYFMKKQLVGFILGLVAMLAAGFFPYAKLKKLKWPAEIIQVVGSGDVVVPIIPHSHRVFYPSVCPGLFGIRNPAVHAA